MTPAAKPSEAAKNRGLASEAQNTTHAPIAVAAPAAATKPKANPTFPVATILFLRFEKPKEAPCGS